MAQYHYVIGYDTEMKKWFLELDTTAYFSDGHVWDEEQYRKEFWGWRHPMSFDSEEELDQTLLNTLRYILDTFPIPKEHEDASTVA